MRHLSSPLDQLNLEAICAYRGTFATSPSAATVGGFFIIVPTMLLISFTVSFSMWSINSLIGFLQQHRTFSVRPSNQSERHARIPCLADFQHFAHRLNMSMGSCLS